ncbi:MAG TPA: hypothetical protein VFE78_02465 [Gemmataceae bacterium]|nr:hypothetical protein [Gemmataceae bacterium]
MSRSDQWVNRTEIRSESSDRVYVVSQHAMKRYLACSCPGWRAHRRCKHLAQLGLPAGEQPFEVEEGRAKKKGFLGGYRTYDTSGGHGSPADWQKEFTSRLGLDEARQALGLPEDAGWDEVRRACHLAAAESMARLVGDYEKAAREFGVTGPAEQKAQAVKAARFRVEAYAAYLEEQKRKLEAEAGRVTEELLKRIEGL